MRVYGRTYTNGTIDAALGVTMDSGNRFRLDMLGTVRNGDTVGIDGMSAKDILEIANRLTQFVEDKRP